MMIGTNNENNRNKWLKQTLARIPPGLRILDAGAGEQKYKPLCKHLSYVAQDFGRYDGEGDGAGLQRGSWKQDNLDIVSDITSIPEQENSFDAIMCIEVLEHLPEPVKALNEFHRLLKPGGHLVLTAPFCSLTHFAPYHYYSGFNKYFFEELCSKQGFEIEEIETNGNYFQYLAQELHRLPEVADKYASARVSLIDKLARRLMFRCLKRFDRLDNKSGELLCYGFHVYAIKR